MPLDCTALMAPSMPSKTCLVAPAFSAAWNREADDDGLVARAVLRADDGEAVRRPARAALERLDQARAAEIAARFP